MATIQEEILDDFLKRLAKDTIIDEDLVKTLRAIFEAEGKPKAQDLVAAYVAARKDSPA